MQRTDSQRKAIHVWFRQKANQCRDAGVTAQMVFNKTIELEMSEELMKEIWRRVQKALYKKTSTNDLDKIGEIDEIAEHLNRFFAENFNLEGTPIPHDPDKISNSPAYHV